MKTRQLDANGDYVFGSRAVILVDSPAAVAQSVLTRLRLFTGEWFLDSRVGLDKARILGFRTAATRDIEIKTRILGTPGVKSITSYSSSMQGRRFSVTATVDTIYGQAQVQGTF